MSEIARYQTPEEKIAKEQKSAQRLTNAKAKLKNIFQTAKKPKFIAVFVLLLTLVVLILALNLTSQKTEEEPIVANTPKLTPTPEPSVDTSIATISKKVQNYNNMLDSLKDYPKKLNYPIVDLDISFEK